MKESFDDVLNAHSDVVRIERLTHHIQRIRAWGGGGQGGGCNSLANYGGGGGGPAVVSTYGAGGIGAEAIGAIMPGYAGGNGYVEFYYT